MSFTKTVLSCQFKCIELLTASSGNFTSPCFPSDYPPSTACKWTLQAPAGFVLQLTFLDFELEEARGCIYDSVVVNTGASIVKFCGLTAHGLTLNSSTNHMVVSFSSDFSVQKRGFSISYRQVAVALRNQKVVLPWNSKDVVRVSNLVTIPTLSEFTVCFEIGISVQTGSGTFFSYLVQNKDPSLTFGYFNNTMALTVGNFTCSVNELVAITDFTPQIQPFCLTWSKTTGSVTVNFRGNHRVKICSVFIGIAMEVGNTFELGQAKGVAQTFDVIIYNFRLWRFVMSSSELSALTCDTVGDVLDWNSTFWNIPGALAQTDPTLSCSSAVPASTSQASCTSPGGGCSETTFYRISLLLTSPDGLSQNLMAQQLNQSFQDWNYTVNVNKIRVQPASDSGSTRYTCDALLMYRHIRGKVLTASEIQNKLSGLGSNLVIVNAAVQTVDSCQAEETPLHYKWPESRPLVTYFIPCFPYKEQNASRTCIISAENYTSVWDHPDLSNCTDIEDIQVSQENAADVAFQLVDLTNNELSVEEMSMVVMVVNKLVTVARINATLASTVVTIISNVISSYLAQLSASKTALKTVDELVQKIEFDGPLLTLTSRNLAVGISAINASNFIGSNFSAFMSRNSSDPQIDFESDVLHPLAVVRLPATLLQNLSSAEVESISRINFMFFSKTGLFQDQPTEGLLLNSYVVASSVGNFSISNLRDPVHIQIEHLHYQRNPKPVCVFWDFRSNNGTGGWNRTGCEVSPESNGNRTICLCNHLTHFGILMDVSGAAAQIDAQNTKILTFITYIGCGISAIFSAVTILTYIAFEKLRRDYPSKILMNLCTSLLFLNMVFLLDGWLASYNMEGLCMAVAAFLHFFLLTSFTWMGLESIHMYIALVKVFNTYIRRYILKFCIVGWGLPAAIIAVVVAADRESYGKEYYGKEGNDQGLSEFCWIRSKLVFYVTCVAYFSIIFLMNVAMFIVVMMQICGRNGKRSNRTLQEEVLRNLRSVISLTFLLGMTWGFAFFAWGPVNLAFMYLFSIFNSLQGLFIFVFHCALKENVQKQWRRYLCCGKFRLSDNSDWSKTATNNTKKVSSDNLGKSLSSSSFGSTAAQHWTSKAKATLNPFTKRHSGAGKSYSNQNNLKCIPSDVDASSSSILPVHQVLDKVKGYCSVRSDNFYKNIILSESFNHSTKF